MNLPVQCRVLPAGSLPVVALPEAASYELKIDRISTEGYEIPEVEVVYPDGFIKWHQAESFDLLMSRVRATLLGRYGIACFDGLPNPGMVIKQTIVLTNVVFKE